MTMENTNSWETLSPHHGLESDALIRTKVNDDNNVNHVFRIRISPTATLSSEFIIKRAVYLDIEGLQHLYGGIKLDIGFPRYIEGWDLADLEGFMTVITPLCP